MCKMDWHHAAGRGTDLIQQSSTGKCMLLCISSHVSGGVSRASAGGYGRIPVDLQRTSWKLSKTLDESSRRRQPLTCPTATMRRAQGLRVRLSAVKHSLHIANMTGLFDSRHLHLLRHSSTGNLECAFDTTEILELVKPRPRSRSAVVQKRRCTCPTTAHTGGEDAQGIGRSSTACTAARACALTTSPAG